MIILHSKHSAESRAFIAKFAEGNLVLDWYDNPEGQLQYTLSGNPQPSGFPFVVHSGKGFMKPSSPQWVKDEVAGKHLTVQEKLDALTQISKMELLDALDELPAERAKFDVLMQDSTFNERWIATSILDTAHPLIEAALNAVNFDIDVIKRQILGIGE